MCAGILRGIGFQAFGAVVNVIGNFLIALPVALSLMFASSLSVAGKYSLVFLFYPYLRVTFELNLFFRQKIIFPLFN